jgi:hypothetical protein
MCNGSASACRRRQIYNLEWLKLIYEDKVCKYIDTGSAATILALAEKPSRNACLVPKKFRISLR